VGVERWVMPATYRDRKLPVNLARTFFVAPLPTVIQESCVRAGSTLPVHS
jgi:hypothetical protein